MVQDNVCIVENCLQLFKQKTQEQRGYVLEITKEAVTALDCSDKRYHGRFYLKYMEGALNGGYE